MNILLVCSAGMSTSLLMSDMITYADENTLIKAVGFSKMEDFVQDYDIVLIGPQLRYKIKEAKALATEYNKPVELIDAIDYGRINGEKVFEFAKSVYEKNYK